MGHCAERAWPNYEDRVTSCNKYAGLNVVLVWRQGVAGDQDGGLPIINEPFRLRGGLRDDVREAMSQRQLLQSLIVRELRQRYKASFLGWGWALVRTLVMLVIYGLAVGVFLGAGASIPEFAIYLYVGLIA